VQEPVPPPPAWQTPSVEDAPNAVTAVAGSAQAVDDHLAFEGVGTQYRGYFAHEDAVVALGEALGSCVSERARVVVTWNDEERIGRIILDTEPDQLRCVPQGEGAADLTGLTGVTRGLASYRDTIASSRDLRVASFRVGVTVRYGAKLCTAWSGGQFPPDGSSFAACPSLAGVETCLEGRPQEGVTSFVFQRPEDQRYWASCFGR